MGALGCGKQPFSRSFFAEPPIMRANFAIPSASRQSSTLARLLQIAVLLGFTPALANSGAAGEPHSFRDCEACPEMVALPAGSFEMGAQKGEPWADEQEEGPRHTVTLRAFALGAAEVTFAEWDACVAEGGCGAHSPDDHGWGRGAQPVVNVSRDDAEQFVAWLNAKVEGAPYRLPSESEWEYAARAGTTTPFWFGRRIRPQDANYNTRHTYGRGGKAEPLRRTAPARAYAANPWGLYDMTGNVWEWTAGCWDWSYKGAPTDGSARRSGDCNEAPMRGGSWRMRPFHLRSANRYYLPKDRRRNDTGFRVAKDLTGD